MGERYFCTTCITKNTKTSTLDDSEQKLTAKKSWHTFQLFGPWHSNEGAWNDGAKLWWL